MCSLSECAATLWLLLRPRLSAWMNSCHLLLQFALRPPVPASGSAQLQIDFLQQPQSDGLLFLSACKGTFSHAMRIQVRDVLFSTSRK